MATQYTRDPDPNDMDAPKPDPEARARAKEVLRRLGPEKDRLEALAHPAGSTKTSLSKLGKQRSADLLEHGYLLAMANLHIIRGYPLLPLPDRSRFDGLAS